VRAEARTDCEGLRGAEAPLFHVIQAPGEKNPRLKCCLSLGCCLIFAA
jgi:hypothetical protein